MNELKEVFPQRLKQVREDRGLTQLQLGEKASIIKQAVSNFEKGRSFPALPVLLSIAETLDVSVDYLLGRTDNPNSHKIKN